MPFGIVKNAIVPVDPVKQYVKEQKQYLKAQKQFAFLKSGKVRKPRAPYRRLTEDEKNMRALDKALRAEIRYSKMKNPNAPRRAAQTTFKKAPITEEQRIIRNLKAKEAYVKRKLIKEGRALQELADIIPLPLTPRAPRRVRVIRQYDDMGRPRLANQAP